MGWPKVRRRRLGWSAIKLWWSAGWIPGWRWLHRLPKVGWWATTERGQRFHQRWWAEVLIELQISQKKCTYILPQAVHHGQPQLQDDQEHEATGHGLWKPNATVDDYRSSVAIHIYQNLTIRTNNLCW